THFGAIVRDGPAGYLNSHPVKLGGKRFVRAGRSGVLRSDGLLQPFLDPGGRDGSPPGSISVKAVREEVLEGKHAPTRLHLLVGKGAAHGGGMELEPLGDHLLRERLESCGTIRKKLLLMFKYG